MPRRPASLLPLALTAALLAAPTAAAETLIPLDSRPATSTLPAQIAALTGQPVHLAPAGLLGNAQKGADPAALTAWLAAQPADGPLIIALDALAYGGLVQSRRSTDSVDTVLGRLQAVRDWHARTGQPVYAFITLPREPDATDRARNLAVARRMVDWAREGVFAQLHVTWDDALPGSPAPAEGAAIAQGAPANVQVYPGADEVLGSLVALAAGAGPAGTALTPLVVEYSQPGTADQVIRYEGIPLSRSVALHAAASGWQAVTAAPEPVLTPFGGSGTRPTAPVNLSLYVYNGGDARAAALRVSQLLRRGPVAVADVASVNVGSPRMWSDLYVLRRPQDLSSLAAWGTPGNNLGTVLAHARVLLAAGGSNAVANPLPAARPGSVTPAPAPSAQATDERQDALLAREYANDIVFGTRVRPLLRKAVPEAQVGTAAGQDALTRLLAPSFPLQFARLYALQSATLPWGRSFEANVVVTPEK